MATDELEYPVRFCGETSPFVCEALRILVQGPQSQSRIIINPPRHAVPGLPTYHLAWGLIAEMDSVDIVWIRVVSLSFILVEQLRIG